MITDYITSMIGEPPVYFEFLPYIIAGVFLLFLIQLVFDVIRKLANVFGSR